MAANIICQLYGNHIILRNGYIRRPSKSPDLTARFFLKSNVYHSRFATIEKLKAKTREVIAKITVEMLFRNKHNFIKKMLPLKWIKSYLKNKIHNVEKQMLKGYCISQIFL